jgi:Holliday junction resolvasome RuvABC endonuclease subunit
MHVEVDFAAMAIAQARGHVNVMVQQPALVLRQFLRRDKGHPRTGAADAIKEDQRGQMLVMRRLQPRGPRDAVQV